MEQETLTNCYGEPITLDPARKWKRKAYPTPPGSGPEGETCRTCRHCWAHCPGLRRYYKCGLMKATGGSATDIVLKSPACARWEAADAPL